jgi:hypothetical protein
MIPHMMRAFFSDNNIVAIQASSEEDYQSAKKAKKLIQYQITQQNYGYTRFRSFMEEAMAINFGAHKCYWSRDVDRKREIINVDHEKVLTLTSDPFITILEIKPLNDGSDLFHVSYEINRYKKNQPVIESVPLSELRWSPHARTLGRDVPFVAHRVPMTVDQLRRRADSGMYDSAAVERAISELEDPEWDDFELERNPALGDVRNDIEDAARVTIVYECYIKTDIDGDGRLEDVVASLCGTNLLRAEVNPDGRHPFFYASAYTDPYKVWAETSLSEIIGQYQHMKTSMIRQIAVNLALNNDPRIFVDESRINLDDLQKEAQWVRCNGNPHDATYPMPVQPIAGWTMPFFEYIETQIEQLSGRSRITRGVVKGSKSDTATGMQLLFGAADAKLEGLIRSFAEGEGGFVEEFRHILSMNQRYLDQKQVIRLMNEPMEVTPDDLRRNFDLVVNAGVGTGDRDQRLRALTTYMTQIAPMGMQMGVVQPHQWAQAAQDLLKLTGIENVNDYITVPEQMQQMMPQGGGVPNGRTDQGAGLPMPGGDNQMPGGVSPEELQAALLSGSF